MIEYCGRPEGFEQKLKKGFEIMKSDDVLIHLGDICIGQDARAHEEFIKPIKSKKWLIKGNHDKKSDTWYLNHGWDFVGNRILLDRYAKKILLSHRPAPDGNYDINIHGHQHNNQAHDLKTDAEYRENRHSKQKLLAIEYVGYEPVSLEKFVAKM